MYPVMLKMEGREALVVGGGRIAERKARSLLDAGAVVTVVSPRATQKIEDLHREGNLTWKQKTFESEDVENSIILIAATDSPEVNEQVFQAGEAAGKLVNSVDDKPNCSFIAPAVIRRGALVIAISTSGTAPYLARRLKEHFDTLLPADLSDRLEELERIRTEVMAKNQTTQSERKQMVIERQESIINGILTRMP